jgi:hypothetical protein
LSWHLSFSFVYWLTACSPIHCRYCCSFLWQSLGPPPQFDASFSSSSPIHLQGIYRVVAPLESLPSLFFWLLLQDKNYAMEIIPEDKKEHLADNEDTTETNEF